MCDGAGIARLVLSFALGALCMQISKDKRKRPAKRAFGLMLVEVGGMARLILSFAPPRCALRGQPFGCPKSLPAIL